MFNQIHPLIYLLTLSCLILHGCTKDQTVAPQSLEELKTAEHLHEIDLRSNCDAIIIPAGSTNALAQAVAEICDEGIIYLAAGEHTQTETLTISKSIKLIGEDGAILKVSGSPKLLELPDGSGSSVIVEGGIHFLNAPQSLVQNIEFQTIETDGNTAILMEQSSGSAIMRCKMTGFQFGILIEKSDRMTMMYNEIITTSLWQSGEVTDAHAITIINGKSAYVANNELSNSVFGIWACDEWGTLENNNAHDNFVGYILCNVPSTQFALPDGTITGSIQPASGYKVRNNVATNSFAEGYLVIDGANQNLLENNAATNSGTYDIELTTLTLRFGFPTPEAYDNTVIVGNHPNLRIKDCGTNNTVIGGILVDTSIDGCE